MSQTAESFHNYEQLLESCGEFVTTVHGVSMYPMLRSEKDPILTVPAPKVLKPYDIAVYDRGDSYVVHRILEVRPDLCVIRGDNCVLNEYVPLQAIKGIVAGFWRFGIYIPVTNRLYLVYSHFWVAINPLVRLHHSLQGTWHKLLHSVSTCLHRAGKPEHSGKAAPKE